VLSWGDVNDDSLAATVSRPVATVEFHTDARNQPT